jgi:hypothetical protein
MITETHEFSLRATLNVSNVRAAGALITIGLWTANISIIFRDLHHSFSIYPSIYPVLLTAVAVFRNPNAIPLCLSIGLVLNVSLSWLSVLRGMVFGLLAFLFFSDERVAGPLHQTPTWRAR